MKSANVIQRGCDSDDSGDGDGVTDNRYVYVYNKKYKFVLLITLCELCLLLFFSPISCLQFSVLHFFWCQLRSPK